MSRDRSPRVSAYFGVLCCLACSADPVGDVSPILQNPSAPQTPNQLREPDPDGAARFDALTAEFLAARGNLEPGDRWEGRAGYARREHDGSLVLGEDVRVSAPIVHRAHEAIRPAAIGVPTWWTYGTPRGVGVRIELRERPPGASELRVALPMSGAEIHVESDQRVEIEAAGMSWVASELYVRDAANRMLPTGFAADVGELAVRVDDGAATYPITIDPIFSIHSWTTVATLTPAPYRGGPPPNWGWSVDTDGERVAVSGFGQVDVFRRVSLHGGGALYTREASWLTRGNAPQGTFGYDVAIDGNRLAVGGAGGETGGGGRGYVDIYVRDGSGWYYEDTVVPEGYDSEYEVGQFAFGRAVDIDGSTLIVGADRYWNARGAAFVYRRNETSWELDAFLAPTFDDYQGGFPPLKYQDSYFGRAVSVDGDRVAVGHAGSGHFSDFEGRVFVFKREFGGAWTLEQVLMDLESEGPDEFGYGLSLVGDELAVSSRNGSHVFARVGEVWTLAWQTPGTAAAGRYGFDFDGTRIAARVSDGMNVFRKSTNSFVFEQTLTHAAPWSVAMGWPILARGQPSSGTAEALERKTFAVGF